MKILQPDTITHARRFGIRRYVGKTLFCALIIACVAASFDANGDTTLKAYGLYKASGPNGSVTFFKALTPPVTS